MRRKQRFLLISIVCCYILRCNSFAEVEDQLKNLFVGRSFTIRDFYRGSHLIYGPDGQLTNKSERGDWSRDGMVEISAVKITRDNALLMNGKRTCIFFNQTNGTFSNVQTGDRIEIEVRLARDQLNPAAIISVLQKVFLTSQDQLTGLVPKYWVNCLAQKVNRSTSGAPWECTPAEESSVPDFANKRVVWEKPAKNDELLNGMQLYIVRHRIGYIQELGMTLPDVESAPDPRFDWTQRRAKLDGTMVLSFDIGKDGQPTGLMIVSPIGMGADDDAARTVMGWRFKAAKCSGSPCTIHARVVFDLTPLFSHRPIDQNQP